jgi:GT2 family glycosyltransferase
VVVDDASPDGVASAVARDFAGVRVLRLPRCRGFCVAANAGIWEARGNIVELLNDDTEVQAGWAVRALASFQDPTVAAVAPLVLTWPHGDRIDSAGDRYYVGGVAGKRGHGEPLGAVRQRGGRVFGASASAAFYRREILLRVGAFPESFGAYFEDVDLAFRLHRAGCQVVFEPAARVLHRIASSHGPPRRSLIEQQSRNEERVFWRNLPWAALPQALPCHCAVLAAKAWRRWQEGGLAPFLWGRLRLLAEVPDLLRHRRLLHRLNPSTAVDDWQIESRYWG